MKLANVIMQMQHIIEQKITGESVLNRSVLGAINQTVRYGNKRVKLVHVNVDWLHSSGFRPLYFLTVY